MITSFQELERHVLSHGLRGRIALANAQDEPALAALVRAQRAGAAEGTLIGPADEIVRLLRGMGEQVSDYEIVPFTGTELDAAKLAVRTVREGRADMLMKGLLHTADFARAILNRETGLMPQTGRRLLSQCGFFQYDGRIVLITDAAININPDVETQIGIVENTLPVAHALGIETPKVAVLSAVETVSEKMPSTVTAREVARRGIPGCVVSGPLAIDSALSRESARHKTISDPVAGQADLLLVPYVEMGDIMYKTCSCIAGHTMASTICGAACPIIINSRSDSDDTKYYSILIAAMMSGSAS